MSGGWWDDIINGDETEKADRAHGGRNEDEKHYDGENAHRGIGVRPSGPSTNQTGGGGRKGDRKG